MSSGTLYDKVWDLHTVRILPNGQTQLFIGLHLVHEVTSPQAFGMLRERGLKVAYPSRTFSTADHVVPTDSVARPFGDSLAESMLSELERNTAEHSITYFGLDSGQRGIVHVMAPELGLVQPGMTVACGDSHTSTLGAFGAIAFGIGTTKVRDVLATQTVAMHRLKVRKVEITGTAGRGVYAKDLILRIIRDLGINSGIGFAYEYRGSAVESLSIEGRMTVCNMSIEAGALIGYMNPDKTTYDYLKGRNYVPSGSEFLEIRKWWDSLRSASSSEYDDEFSLSANGIEPMVTWGTNPGQSIGIRERVPKESDVPEHERQSFLRSCNYMGFSPGQELLGVPVNVVFIGSCTNSRLSDLREAAKILEGRSVAKGVRALAVPGSMAVKLAAEKEGIDKIFRSAGFQWRLPGCSMCLAMNQDRLVGSELCASTSNRNFMGRMGSPSGRTVLMSPAMAAAAAVEGKIADVRDYL